MIRFVLKRLALALITLFLLSVVVFAVSNILPGNVGRSVLGPFATQESVDALNDQLGTNRPLLTQYLDWAGGLVQGDLGMSLQGRCPAWDLLGPAIVNSAKLALLAFIICIPLSILGGDHRRAPLRQGDRQVDHSRRDLAGGDAGLRLWDRPHPRSSASGSAGCRSPPSGRTAPGHSRRSSTCCCPP